MKIFIKILILVILVCTGSTSAKSVSKSVSPLFWKLEYQDKISFAFGSIHLAEKVSYPLPDVVMKGYRRAEALVVEVDLNNISTANMNALIGKYGVDPQKPLNSYFTPEVAKKYDVFCQTKHLSCEQFSRFKPWLVSLTFMSMQAMQSGLNAEQGIDKYFLGLNKDKKPVIELETAQSQLALFNSLNDQLQLELLLQSMTTDKLELQSLIEHWYKGDEAALTKLFNKTTDSELEEVFFEALLFKRNRQMSEKLVSLLKTGRSLFVVIGTGHLVGRQSVLELLQKQGVKVTPHQYGKVIR
jgi:uncharacterized protein YbaP (TraB family)